MQRPDVTTFTGNPWDRRSFEWALRPGALVVEVGGFDGRWCSGMLARYPDCEMHVFEPQTQMLEMAGANMLRAAPDASPNLHSFGIGDRNGIFRMHGWNTDSNSFLKDEAYYLRNPEEHRRETGFGELREASVVFDDLLEGRPIDVMCMNIEGYEFVLLPYMAERRILPRVRNIMVQFHEGITGVSDEPTIRRLLGDTHDVLWDYPALTAWGRRA